jgi:hypothetical protein
LSRISNSASVVLLECIDGRFLGAWPTERFELAPVCHIDTDWEKISQILGDGDLLEEIHEIGLGTAVTDSALVFAGDNVESGNQGACLGEHIQNRAAPPFLGFMGSDGAACSSA